jgi:hypothetical protein
MVPGAPKEQVRRLVPREGKARSPSARCSGFCALRDLWLWDRTDDLFHAMKCPALTLLKDKDLLAGITAKTGTVGAIRRHIDTKSIEPPNATQNIQIKNSQSVPQLVALLPWGIFGFCLTSSKAGSNGSGNSAPPSSMAGVLVLQIKSGLRDRL